MDTRPVVRRPAAVIFIATAWGAQAWGATDSVRSVWKSPPLASKHEEYRMASSTPRKSATRRSSSLCSVWVQQMKRTEERPYPQRARAAGARRASPPEPLYIVPND